ncbi:hypothetical protein ACFQ0M_48415 [Kitasatospora aburaviensis]
MITSYSADGVPSCALLSTAARERGGGHLPILAIVPFPHVPAREVEGFIARHGFVRAEETARAANSTGRWSMDAFGAHLHPAPPLAPASIKVAPDPNFFAWSALARANGATVALVVVPGLPDHDRERVARALGAGAYWKLSVGMIPA